VPEISDNINDIDNAMKWGFGWEVGPFEIWEMIGLSKSIKRMNSENKLVPNWVIALLEQEKNIFIRSEINNKKYYRT
jgi:3-hydroxyacyl-CoA dehydrogenase